MHCPGSFPAAESLWVVPIGRTLGISLYLFSFVAVGVPPLRSVMLLVSFACTHTHICSSAFPQFCALFLSPSWVVPAWDSLVVVPLEGHYIFPSLLPLSGPLFPLCIYASQLALWLQPTPHYHARLSELGSSAQSRTSLRWCSYALMPRIFCLFLCTPS